MSGKPRLYRADGVERILQTTPSFRRRTQNVSTVSLVFRLGNRRMIESGISRRGAGVSPVRIYIDMSAFGDHGSDLPPKIPEAILIPPDQELFGKLRQK